MSAWLLVTVILQCADDKALLNKWRTK